MAWINFYSISFVVVAVVLAVSLYYVSTLMEYQNAGTPWPPGAASCPDGWVLDAAGWCVIPGVDAGCSTSSSSPSSPSGPAAWQTTGSLPSAWARRQTCSSNTGTLHTDDASYARLISLVPAVHKPAAVAGTFTSADIRPADFRAGKVAIHFTEAPLEARRKFCAAYGIFWDGVHVAEPTQ